MSTPIYTGLTEHAKKHYASFHTPGHKNAGFFPEDLLQYDLTELPDTDALYEADGMISQAEQQIASLFGAEKSLISCGGCTLAIQTMLRIASKHCRKILFARNIHRSAVNACALLGIEPLWLMPEPENGFTGVVNPTEVEKMLQEHSDIGAVYLTSPDYYGELSDIAAISAVCHRHNALLLTDNAHGSHLAFLEHNLHPIALGADLSACSLHKTLPVLTGGAVLNIGKGDLAEGAKEAMSLFGSTSPSYVVMASIDLCCDYLLRQGTEEYRKTQRRVARIKNLAKEQLLPMPAATCDPLRVCVNTAAAGLKGSEKQTDFFHGFGVEPEFCDGVNAVFICTPMNREEDFRRLEKALHSLKGTSVSSAENNLPPLPKVLLSPREATLSDCIYLPVQQAVGKIAADSACPCPPGIPVVMPGEVITSQAAAFLKQYGIDRLCCVRE